MIPVANFTISTWGLTIQFIDTSSNVPTSWAWNFGDSINNTSTLQNPSHTFSVAGTYIITLISSNTDGSSAPTTKSLIVTTNPGTGLTIEEMVALELPPGLSFEPALLQMLKSKWQLTLYKSFTPNIADVDIYNQSAWPPLVNFLIAKLVIYDCILKVASSVILGVGASGSSTSTGTSSGTGSGGIKRIAEGPAEAEWYDTSSFLNSLFKSGGTTGTNANKQSGVFGELTNAICGLASALQIHLTMCNEKSPIVPWLKAGRPCPVLPSSALFPFNIYGI